MKHISTGSPFETAMGYNRAVVKGGWCFVSGVTGYDYATMTMPEGIVKPRAENCFATIWKVLAEAGFQPADIVHGFNIPWSMGPWSMRWCRCWAATWERSGRRRRWLWRG